MNDLLPIKDVPAAIERRGAPRPHRATVERWRQRGVRGVKLDSQLIGGRRFVSEAALDRFLEAINGDFEQRISSAKRRERVERDAKRLGV